jgi:peptidoglycan-associated lipoprotein
MLEMEGVFPEQLEIISYGEMKPSEEGHDQAAWQLNRRVEITYQARS